MGNKKTLYILGFILILLVLIYLVANISGISKNQSAALGTIQDFILSTSGPHHVVQGHNLFFQVTGIVINGTDESGTTPSVSGLPSGATASFVNMVRYCCGTSLYRLAGSNPIEISTSANTPVGTYPITITYTTLGGLQRSTTYTIYVDPVPTLVQKSGNYYPADVPLTSLNQWKSNMTVYGLKHCTATEISPWSSYGVDYYDGARVYYQIADYTGDSSWNNCANLVHNAYSKYVNDNNGQLPGYYVFPQGLAMKYQRAGDSAAKQTLSTLQANSPYSNWPDTSYVIDWGTSREVSYAIETNLMNQSIGGTPNSHLADLVDIQLGHFDQWFQTKNAPIAQPFMVALAAEAMIQYWDVTHDPRIPPILQMAADQMWSKSLDPSCDCFRYYDDVALDGSWSQVTTDLNLLIAPLYGWLYQQTGAQIYRDEGDRIFNSGVAGAWLDGGKQFSQNYRWSNKYVEWRNLNGQRPPSPTPTPTPTPLPKPQKPLLFIAKPG